jgi:hypothetical protein
MRTMDANRKETVYRPSITASKRKLYKSPPNQVAAFIDAAVSDLRRPEEMLAEHPQIAGAGFYASLVLGDWHSVERALTESPHWPPARAGPETGRRWFMSASPASPTERQARQATG